MNFPPRWQDISVQARVPTRSPFRGEFGAEVVFDKETGALEWCLGGLAPGDLAVSGFWSGNPAAIVVVPPPHSHFHND